MPDHPLGLAPLPGQPNTPDASRYKWYVVWMLWCVSLCNYADRQAIFSLFPLLRRSMALSDVQLGLLGSSFAWVYGLISPLAGNLADRISRKTAILSGLCAWSGVCTGSAASVNFTQLVSFRGAQGLGESVYYPAAMSMISDYHAPASRSRAMGLHQTSVYAGTIAGGFFAALIGERYGWRVSIIVFGAMGVVLALVLKRFLREPARGAADSNASPPTAPRMPERRATDHRFLGAIFKNPTALCLMAAFACANFVAAVLLAWMPDFLYNRFHFGLAMAGLSAVIFVQLASMAGSVIGGWTADLLHKRKSSGRVLVQGLAVFAGAPFVWLCGATQTVSVLIFALTAWGLFKGLYDANIFASLYDVVPAEARGTAAGFMNMVGWAGGGGLGPAVVGFVAERSSLGAAISLSALVYILAGVFLSIPVLFERRLYGTNCLRPQGTEL
ncbi:MAG TPA: MFS transporter [Terriglobia bacterium]|nr:MFS transporter [Terriglobia bacterium]